MDQISTLHMIEAIGWAGSFLTVATYAMNTMVPLRLFAVASNICIGVYAALLGLWPLLVMDLVLLPINLYRLWQIIRLRRALAYVPESHEPDFSVVKAYGKRRSFDTHSIVFEKGDPVDSLYFLETGRVEIEGVGVELGGGEIFGEMAFFTDSATRTASVRCLENTVVYELDKLRFMRLQFEDPSFGMAIMRTITRRLQDNLAQAQPA
ncbi:MAG: cyclic nucleotide-binding domain-containing protein [Pseudomonadota bacterium]